jgi:histidine triad (HIT) family protein
MSCIFCKIVAGESPAHVVYEDDLTLAFMDKYPIATGHTLVIPKRHVENVYELGDEDAAAVMRATARVARAIKLALKPHGINLLQSNERAAGQDIFHFHMHVVPRWHGDGLITPRHFHRQVTEPLHEVAARIRAHMS